MAESIINDGYHSAKACCNNLLVEAAVDKNGQVDRKFTEHYLATAGKDEHNLIDPCAMAEYGALCNNTMNICNRNIRGGKLGCACVPPAMAGDCTCKAKPILDDKGNFSFGKLRIIENDWFLAVLDGSDWEILDSAIDIEEPDAAHIISVALNRKKNAPALVTGHMEIMRSLVALCEPNPRSHEVPFDPVKKKLLELFGSDVDQPGFEAAYKLVVLSGGCDSPTFKDLFNWADYFVDDLFRK